MVQSSRRVCTLCVLLSVQQPSIAHLSLPPHGSRACAPQMLASPTGRRAGKPPRRSPRPAVGGDEPRWNHKKLRGPEPTEPGSLSSRSRGRSRSAKREAYYAQLSSYSAHFSSLLRSEWQAEQDTLRNQIQNWPIPKLRKAGLLLDRLCVRHIGELYGSPVIRLSLRPSYPTQSAGERSANRQLPFTPNLPYHTFRIGDAVTLCTGDTPILLGMDPSDAESKAPVCVDDDALPGVLLQHTSSNVLVVVGQVPKDRLDRLRSADRLCLCRGASAVPFERSQLALDSLTDPALPAESIHPDLRQLVVCQTKLQPPFRMDMRHGAPLQASAYNNRVLPEVIAVARGRPSYLPGNGGKRLVRDALAAVAAASNGPLLNPSQAGTVAAALQRRLTLIQGPPGTGKTRTACHILAACATLRHQARSQQVVAKDTGREQGGKIDASGDLSKHASQPSRRASAGSGVLAVASSNVAADELLAGLRELGVAAVRIGQPASIEEKCRAWSLDALVSQDAYVREARTALASAQAARDNSCVAKQFARVQAAEAAAGRRALLQAPVVVSTCVGSGRLAELLAQPAAAGRPETNARSCHFRTVLLDEASQAVEPTSLIGALFGCEQLILVGDPFQLPPTVVSSDAVQGGLGLTLFERLADAGIEPLLLNEQYRMHPAIAEFPSREFYNRKLRTAVTVEERPVPAGFPWPRPEIPIAFTSVEGTERREATDDGASISNELEADAIVRAVHTLLEAGESPSGIGIIAPYAAQVRAPLLIRLL